MSKRNRLTVTLVCDTLIQRNRTGGVRLNARRFVDDFPAMAGRTITYVVNGPAQEIDPLQAEWLFRAGYLCAKRPGYWGEQGGDTKRLVRSCPVPGWHKLAVV